MARHREIPLRRKLVVSAVSTIVLFGAWEAGLRLTGRTYWTPPLLLKSVEPYFDKELRAQESLYLHDDEVFWRMRPRYVEPITKDELNALGYRGPDLARIKPPGTVRIAVIGDSCTYGTHTGYEDTYGARLVEFLSVLHPERAFELVNVGVSGYTMYQGSVVFREDALPLEPDIAVFYFGWNDAKGGYRGSDSKAAFAKASRTKSAVGAIGDVLDHSAVYRMLRAQTGLRQGPTYDEVSRTWLADRPLYENRVPPDEFDALLGENLELCRANGIQPIVVLPEVRLPVRGWTGVAAEVRARWTDEYRERSRAAALAHGATMLDMRELFAGLDLDELYRPHDPVHPNADGYLLLARGLAGRIEAQRWVQPRGPCPTSSPRTGARALAADFKPARPGRLGLALNAGPGHAGEFYALLPSLRPSDPATGRPAMVNAVFGDTARASGLGLLGRLDEHGRANAEVILPETARDVPVLGFAFKTGPDLESILSDWVEARAWTSNRIWLPLAGSD